MKSIKQLVMLLAAIGIGFLYATVFFLVMSAFRPVTAISEVNAPIQKAAQVSRPRTNAVPSAGNVQARPYGFGPIKVVSSALNPSISPGELALGLALAMDISRSHILTAELWCDPLSGACTDPAAVAVMGLAPGTWFPTRDTTFALLSTGSVIDIEPDAIAITETMEVGDPGEQETLNGLKNAFDASNAPGNDLVRLHLVLTAPVDAKCISFDYTFYTVDIYTDTEALACANISGDTFTAQYNNAELSFPASTIRGLPGIQVSAPNNFAFNLQGEMVTSYSMSPIEISKSFRAPLGTNFPEIYPLLQARHAVSGGEQFDLYLSIQDVGNSTGNSAVALDNFEWITDTTDFDCPPNHRMGWSGDQDGDGLPNGWERYGKYARDLNNELTHIDLKRMGADPTVKDIFVEIDTVKPFTIEEDSIFPAYFSDPTPISQAITYIVDAFARAPVDEISVTNAPSATQFQSIRLHVDYGAHAPLHWYQGEGNNTLPWGALSGAEILSDTNASSGLGLPRRYLCDVQCVAAGDEKIWDEVDLIKSKHFSVERSAIFHYALFAHDLYDCAGAVHESTSGYCARKDEGSTGVAREIAAIVNGGSDFLVTLGHYEWQSHDYPTRTVQQAGTFMHELGHNLGLHHSGTTQDITETKPNHLSVMNYLYQTRGLVVENPNRKFDYLHHDMALLNESHLNELTGIQPRLPTVTLPSSLGARHYCAPLLDAITATPKLQPIDWNCFGGFNQDVEENITGNRTELGNDYPPEMIIADSEWDKLVFTGGTLFRQRTMLKPNITERENPCFTIVSTHSATIQPVTIPLPHEITIPLPSEVVLPFIIPLTVPLPSAITIPLPAEVIVQVPATVTFPLPGPVINRRSFPPSALLPPSPAPPQELTPEIDARILK